MGTRGFVGFVSDGVEKIFVSHKDSYPSGGGVEVLQWLSRHREALVRPVPGGMRDQVRSLRVLPDWEALTPADVERVRRLLIDRAEHERDRHYLETASEEELLEDASYDLDTLLPVGIIMDGSDFPADSLFCEWGYLIDLDTGTFEAYRGFQRTAHAAGRFADRPPANEGYHPVALVASWPLTDLPDPAGFVAAIRA
jgi:hypothetical protein